MQGSRRRGRVCSRVAHVQDHWRGESACCHLYMLQMCGRLRDAEPSAMTPASLGEKSTTWLSESARHQDHQYQCYYSGRSNGKAITSLIDAESVSSMISRSMPMPMPPVGGMPCSNAVRKSSSTPHASSSPAAFLAFSVDKIFLIF